MSGFVWDKPENASHANMVLSYHGEILDNVVYLKYLPSMRVLWRDSGIPYTSIDCKNNLQCVSHQITPKKTLPFYFEKW